MSFYYRSRLSDAKHITKRSRPHCFMVSDLPNLLSLNKEYLELRPSGFGSTPTKQKRTPERETEPVPVDERYRSVPERSLV